MNNKSMKKIQTQHFGIRKLSIGIASVLLGTTVLFVNNKTVQASSDDNSQPTPTDAKAPDSPEKTGNTLNLPANQNSDSNGQDPNSADDGEGIIAKTGTMTKKEAMEALDIDKKELSDEKLAKLGLTRDTYRKNNIIYKAAGSVEFTDTNNKKYRFNLSPIHNDDGSMYSFDQIRKLFADEGDFAIEYGLFKVFPEYKYAPVITGKTIYITQGHSLDTKDINRGLPKSLNSTYETVSWDNDPDSVVNVNKAGTYDGIVDVTYKSELGQSVGVKVVVVDPQGIRKEAFVGDSIPTDAKDYLTYTPITFTPKSIEWAKGVSAPSTAKAGTFTKQIVITYPDGNKGMALATIIVANPRKTVDQTKEVVRTINDNVPQDPTVITQKVIFGRSVTVDVITGDMISSTDWTPQGNSAVWDAYTAKGKDGYEASPATVPAMAVTDNTADVVVNIDYTPVSGLDTAPKPKVPSVIPQGTEPTPDDQIPSEQSSDKVLETVVPKAAAAIAKPEKVSTAVKLDTKRNNHALLAANKVAKKAALPKTGQQGNGLMVAIGLTFVAVSSLFALAGGKKKKY